MKTLIQRFCMTLIVLAALVEVTTTNENETSTVAYRQSRVQGRTVKLYSGYKTDPIVCTKEGFKADPIHCATFYRCLKSSNGKFTVFKFQCGPGTIYDPENEVCNHPSSTKRSECGGLTSHIEEDNDNDNDIIQHELPSPISTISPVYTNHRVPILSNSDIHSPTAEKVSSVPTLAPYTVITTQKRPQYANDNFLVYPWTNHKNITNQSTKITSTTTISSILDTNERCTSDGFIGDNNNCKKFYRCVSNSRGGFIRYEFLCSDPTVWDDQMQGCNHPWAVRNTRCGRDNINNENSFLDITDISTGHTDMDYGVIPSKNPDQNMNQKIEIKPKEPVANYGDKLNNVDEPNVEKNFINYESQSSIPFHDKNIATEFNVYNEDVYGFGLKTAVSPTYSTNKVLENNFTHITELKGNFICTQSGFIGDPKNCKNFYRCVDNGKGSFTKYEFSCSDGTVWDRELEACNYAWAVKECGSTSAVYNLSTMGIRTSTSTSTSSTTILDENINSGYINQDDKKHESPSTIIFSTPVSLISTTAASDAKGMECKITGFIGDFNDCSKFYRCVDSGKGTYIKYEYKCGDGTLWDQNIEACNHAWAVKECSTRNSFKNNTLSTATNNYSSTNINDVGIITTVSSSTSTYKPQNYISDYDYGYALQQHITTENPVTVSHLTTSKQQPTTPKQTLENKNVCRSSGFIGDLNNCNKFYRCVDNGNGGFVQYEFSCGEGTVWDPEIEACNHAWAVKECGASTSNENISTSSITNLNLEESITGHVTQNYSDIENTTPHTNVEPTLPAVHKNNICKANGFMGDENDCRKFYRCVDSGNGSYIRYDFSCGEGTLWDSQIHSCNHAWAVKDCRSISTETVSTISVKPSTNAGNEANYDENSTPSNKDINNITETTTLHSTTTTLMTVTNKSNDCKSSGFMGDYTDCQKFYRCVDNGHGDFMKYEFMCGDGTVWDTKIEACNHKWAVEKCGGNTSSEFLETTTQPLAVISPVTQSITTTTLSNLQMSNTTEVPHSTDISSISNATDEINVEKVSNNKCTSEGFYPNNENCQRFYRCVDNGDGNYTMYEFSCAEGTAWDINTQSCNYINEVKACTLNQQSDNVTEISTVPDKQSTKPYATKTSTLASTTQTSKPAIQNNCEQEGYFGHSENCNKFYRCVYNSNGGFTKYDFTCGEGTIWDQDIIACNHPYDVKNSSCIPKQESTSPMSTSSTAVSHTETPLPITSETPSSTISGITDNKNDTNSNSSNNSSTESPNSNGFTCTKPGFYADLSNCKKFYRCVDWENNGEKFSVFHFECADGTIWDPALETCNYEDSVYPPRNCNTTQQQYENVTETSTQTTTTTNQAESTSLQNTETTQQSTLSTTQATTTTSPNTSPQTQTTQSTSKASTTQSSTTEELTTKLTTDEVTTKSTTQLSTTEEVNTKPTTQTFTTEEVTTKPTTQSFATEEVITTSLSTKETTTQSTTTNELSTQYTTTTAQSTTDTTLQPGVTDATTTELSQEQTTKSSTVQTTNLETTTTGSSTTVTHLTSTDQTLTTTEQATIEQSTITDSVLQTTNSQFTTEETSSSSTTENNQEISTETNSANNKECPDTDSDQSLYVCPTSFKRHPKYCNLFYQCTEDNDNHELKIAVFNCPNNTIYDESKIQCVEEKESNKKCNGQIAQKHRVKRLGATHNAPFIVTKESMACKNIGHFPFERHTKCSTTLIKCGLTQSGKLKGYVYRCPEGYIYWTISRRCEAITNVRDCKRSSYPWNRRHDIPLERFNIAP